MSFKERFKIVENRILLNAESEQNTLAEDIRRITRLNASKGKLKSGQTLVEVQRAMFEIIEQRKQMFVDLFNQAEFHWEPNLESELVYKVDKLFSTKLGGLQVQLDKLYQLVGSQRAAEKVQTEIIATMNHVRSDLNLLLQNKLSILKSQKESAHVKHQSKSKVTEDIVDIKPNFMGVGLNLNAMRRWFRDRKT